MPKIGVLLAGCGRYDGSDVHETVLLGAALERRGARLVYLAPEVEQAEVFDHASGHRLDEAPARQVLDEAARLAPGPIRPLDPAGADDLDALAIPGGGGAVRGLCESTSEGLGGGALRADVRRLLDTVAARGGVVAAVGLAEVVVARWLDEALDPDAVRMAPDEIRVRTAPDVLYAAGRLRAGSLADLASAMDRLAVAVIERLPAGTGTRLRLSTEDGT
jgi:enhancing lycopene biosynthesis protein 2